MHSSRLSRRLRLAGGALGPCLLSGALCAILLAVVLRLDNADLRMPLNYLGDAVTFLLKAKGIAQGEWIHGNSQVGMPFGADFRDFPLNITWDSAILWVISFGTKNAGLMLNLYWLFAIVAAAVTASYGLLRLKMSPVIAVAVGVVFALQPYGFYRGISHLHSLYYLVPLLATGAIELATRDASLPGKGAAGLWSRLRSAPAYLWIGAFAVGLSYAYTAFFSCFVLAVATLLRSLRLRRLREAAVGIAVIVVICAAAGLDLSPTFLHRAKNGKNYAMDFKYPAEAEIYGLKIRFLLTPIPSHPLAPFRFVEEKLRAASFPLDNENGSARLGTLGSIGFLTLLGYALARCAGGSRASDEPDDILGVSAALCVACVLLATIGGFSDFFNTFVAPDIRCYNRIAPFISFFSLVAIARLLGRFQRSWATKGLPSWLFAILLLGGTAAAARDQAVTSGYLPHSAREDLYRHDDAFVKAIEATLPAGAMIFQLPYTDFPVEILRGRMFNNDHGRPYVHSERLRWSWGAISGTTAAEWNKGVAVLPAPIMVHLLHHAGFAGIWLDLFGYDRGNSPEAQLSQALGVAPMRSEDGRYLFFDMRAYGAAIDEAESASSASERRESHPIEVIYERGFYDEEKNEERTWRWARERGRMTLLNPLDEPRVVTVRLELQTGSEDRRTVRIGLSGETEAIEVALRAPYTKQIEIPRRGRVEVDLSCDCDRVVAPGDPREMYFGVAQVEIIE